MPPRIRESVRLAAPAALGGPAGASRPAAGALPSAHDGARRGRRPGHPDRARLDGRDGRPCGGPLRRLDPAGRPELPDLRPADAACLHPGPGPDQAGRRRGQRRAGPARPGCCRRNRGCRRRGRRGPPRRRLPDRHLPDGLGHLDQHERERGDRPSCRRPARAAGPSQRRGERRPILERHDPQRDAAGRRPGDPDEPPARAGPAAPGPRGQGPRVRPDRENRPDPSPGRDPDPARPGVRRLRRPGQGIDPAGERGPRRAAQPAPRRNRGRNRDQRPGRGQLRRRSTGWRS